MADREKVIKGLEEAKEFIRTRSNGSASKICRLMDVCNAAVILLKEQEVVVHCGDCENFCFDSIFSPNAGHCMLTNKSHSKTWFCAHGKREEGW